MSGKSRMAVEFISCPVFMIDIDMLSVSLVLKQRTPVVTNVLSMTLNALYMSLQVR